MAAAEVALVDTPFFNALAAYLFVAVSAPDGILICV